MLRTKLALILALVFISCFTPEAHARWLMAQQGRFISRDPIGYRGGINVYTYVGNTPASFRDPYGLITTSEFGQRTSTDPYDRTPIKPNNETDAKKEETTPQKSGAGLIPYVAANLGYETVSGPVTLNCGGLDHWKIRWVLDQMAKASGQIVQSINVSFDVKDCEGKPVKHPNDDGKWGYWEGGWHTFPHQSTSATHRLAPERSAVA